MTQIRVTEIFRAAPTLNDSRGEYRCVYQRRANGRVSTSALWVEAKDELDAYAQFRRFCERERLEIVE